MSGHVAMRRWAPRCCVLSRTHIYLDMGAPCVLASRHPSSTSRRAITLNRALSGRKLPLDEPVDELLEPLARPVGLGLRDAARLDGLGELRLRRCEHRGLQGVDALALLLREPRERGAGELRTQLNGRQAEKV